MESRSASSSWLPLVVHVARLSSPYPTAPAIWYPPTPPYIPRSARGVGRLGSIGSSVVFVLAPNSPATFRRGRPRACRGNVQGAHSRARGISYPPACRYSISLLRSYPCTLSKSFAANAEGGIPIPVGGDFRTTKQRYLQMPYDYAMRQDGGTVRFVTFREVE